MRKTARTFLRAGVTLGGQVDPAPVLRTLTITPAGDGDGIVTGPGINSPDNTEQYPHGTVVALGALAESGSAFDGWSGDVVSTSPSIEVVMTANKTITATFSEVEEPEPTGNSLVPGTGTVLKEDLALTNDPFTNLWIRSNSAFLADSTVATSDPLITRRTDDGDPHEKVGGGVNAAYRRFSMCEVLTVGSQSRTSTLNVENTTGTGRTTLLPSSGRFSVFNTNKTSLLGGGTYSGKTTTTITGINWQSGSGTIPSGAYFRVQSIYDAGVPNISWRTMVARQNPTTFHVYRPGDIKATYFSVRLDDPWPQPGSTEWQDGLLVQIKQFNSGGAPPVIKFTETRLGIRLLTNEQSEIFFTCQKGIWLRFAIICKYHSSSATGWIELWGDLTESGDMTQIMPRRSRSTLASGQDSALSLGPYQRMERPARVLDFANVQVTNFTP